MGYRIESYTLDQLQKVSLPGNAITALFWAIPLGRWPLEALDRFWNHFTKGQSHCRNLGLLLVKDQFAEGRRENSQSVVKGLRNSIHAGILSDLIPQRFSARILDPSDPHGRPGFLILSGNYPQPGWGLLLDAENLQPDYAEKLVREAVPEAIRNSQVISDTASLWGKLQDVRAQQPVAPTPNPAIQTIARLLTGFDGAMQSIDSNVDILKSYLNDVVSITDLFTHHDDGVAYNDTFTSALRDLIQMHRIRPLVVTHRELPLDRLIEAAAANAQDQTNLIRTLDVEYRAIANALLYARRTQPDLTWIDYCNSFEEETFNNSAERMNQLLHDLKQKLLATHRDLVGAFETERLMSETRCEHWKKHHKDAEIEYREKLSEATVVLWEQGPEFLVRLEDVCRSNQVICHTISWDPARMVGWRLRVRFPDLRIEDLALATNEFISSVALRPNSAFGKSFDGSVFADYVYFLALSSEQPGKTSFRQSALKIMTALLAARYINVLSDLEKVEKPLGGLTTEGLADKILERWGWIRNENSEMVPLISTVAYNESDSKYSLRISANEIRISLESFIKDLLWICLDKNIGENNQPDKAIQTYCPRYIKNPRHRTWKDIIGEVMVGPGVLLLRGFLPLAFSGKTSIDSFLDNLERAGKYLNSLSHDNPNDNNPLTPAQKEHLEQAAGNHIMSSINLLNQIVGEMPWHFEPMSCFGTQPSVLTGPAWSHSHPEKRIIRVLSFGNESLSETPLVWNQTQTNPVMVDARFLR